MTERAQTTIRRSPPEETARLGMEIYERKIRERVDHDQEMKIVAIDVESENWTIGDNYADADKRLKSLLGDAYVAGNVFMLPVGRPAPIRWTRGLPWAGAPISGKGTPKSARILKGSSKPIEEIVRLGKKIYERDIRAQVEHERNGNIVAIDVDSGEWAISRDPIGAGIRLEKSRPEAENIMYVTVGYRESAKAGS